MPPIILGGLYRHYKGNYYRVLHLARHSETEEPLVVYLPLYGECGMWVRPLPMFLERVQHNGQEIPRFAYVPPAGQASGILLEVGLSPALAAQLGAAKAGLWVDVCRAFPSGAITATPGPDNAHSTLHCCGVPASQVTMALHRQMLALGIAAFGVQVKETDGKGLPLQQVVMLPGPAGHEVEVGIEITGSHARITLLEAAEGAARTVCLMGGDQIV